MIKALRIMERYARSRNLWISRKPGLNAALLATQQPKWLAVPSSCTTFVTGCSTQQPLRPTLETGGTGSCAGAPSSSGSRHTLPSARKSLEAVKKLLWPMVTPSSAAAAAREIPAHLQCHCGGNLGTAVRCMTWMNSAQASFVVLARQPWMAEHLLVLSSLAS